MDKIKEAMQAKLEAAGLPFVQIKVFGVLRCNVHVTCLSRDAAAKWATLLAGVFKGAKVACVEHSWNAAANKGTCLLPTMRDGFLVAVAA